MSAGTKSEQQTGTSNVVAVTPARQQDHDSAAKAWVSFTGRFSTGGAAIDASYNVASVTKMSTGGVYVIAFTTAFATANYTCQVGTEDTSAAAPVSGIYSTVPKTSSQVWIFYETLAGASGDPLHGHVVCYGRQ